MPEDLKGEEVNNGLGNDLVSTTHLEAIYD